MIFPPAVTGGVAGYQVAKSIRLRQSASGYLSWTPGVAGNRRTWTWVACVKRGSLGANRTIFAASNGGSVQMYLQFTSADVLEFVDWDGVSVKARRTTNAVFRDPSAHMQIMLRFDTTQATAGNRVRLYVDGIQLTSFSTSIDPALNYVGACGSTIPHAMGREEYADTSYFDGYLSIPHFTDGLSVDPGEFGESVGGVWMPKEYAGSYGTNGWHLPFDNGTSLSTLTADASGNGNNWTANNISLTAGVNYDWMEDTPTNNFTVLNALLAGIGSGNSTLSAANLVATSTSGGSVTEGAYSNVRVSSGKWFCEITPASGSAGAGAMVGIMSSTTSHWYYNANGNKYTDTTNNGAYGATFTDGDVIGIALDLDAGTVTFYKNGVSQGVAFSSLSGSWVFGVCDASSGATTLVAHFNAGQRPFSYTPPTGYQKLCTANLTNTTITTSGSFTGNASADGPFVWLNGVPTAMTINGNAVTFGTHADKTAGGFKVRSSSASYNTAGSNTYSITTTGAAFKNARAQVNP